RIPPQKPGNISCVFYYKSTLTCSWASGREAHTETSYVLIKKDEFETCPEVNCSNKTFSCSRTQEPFSDLDYCVQVKAKNNFGKVESECIPQSSPKIFKPNAPQISKIEPVPGKKQSLKVFWQKLESLRTDPTKFQIRYRAGKENSTKNVTFFGNTESTSYVLTDLWNFTNYTVAFRWTIEQSSEWSEWSTDKMGTTEEQAPLRVDLWRVIKSHQSFGNRTVRLLWKKCQEFPSSGIVNGYRVKYFKEGNVSFERSVDLNKAITGYTLNLSEEAYEVSVIAHNTVGDSPEAILRIPSMYEESNGEFV
uniref:Interleukin 31 receptor A n=1 Tax=Salvator merianae TaxID=96440 RepID=A0A8D0KJS9_SALMN